MHIETLESREMPSVSLVGSVLNITSVDPRGRTTAIVDYLDNKIVVTYDFGYETAIYTFNSEDIHLIRFESEKDGKDFFFDNTDIESIAILHGQDNIVLNVDHVIRLK